jgi:hypothetical protein
MKTKLDIIGIIAAVVITLSFFLPWVGMDSVLNISAFDFVKEILKELFSKNPPDDFGIYLPLILIAFPISSIIIIVNEINNNSSRVIKNSKGTKITIIIVMVLTIIKLISISSKQDINIFDLLKLGFYLTLVTSIYLFITLFYQFNQRVTETQIGTMPYISYWLPNHKLNVYYKQMNGYIKNINHNKDIDVNHFLLACYYSFLKEKDSSYFHLCEALRNGYDHYQFIKDNLRLKFLRTQPEYIELEKNNFVIHVSNDNSKFCNNCGKKYDKSFTGEFCESCGGKL